MPLSIAPTTTLAPVRAIALTGCDGSGKSTLAARLVAALAADQPVAFVYLGQSSGRIGEWIGTLPLVGPTIRRALVRKSEGMHTAAARAPGAVAALVVYALSRWRLHKFKRMLALARQGTLVITDRYPQRAIAGFRFDGPQLAKTQGGGALTRLLRGREQALYDWMAARPPLLVMRLNIDAETAHARKPDHALAMLREKTAVWPQLVFGGAPILELDARDPADAVFQQALDAIHAACVRPLSQP